jgi:hypothetical protein
MSSREPYAPGAASGAEVRKEGEKWTEYAKQFGVETPGLPSHPRT